MSIIRVVRDNRLKFLISDVEIHQNQSVSWEARGLHAYLMSKPPDWTVRKADLINAGPAGKDKIQRMMFELEEAGYLSREKVHDPETGRYKTTSSVYECVALNPNTPIYGGNGNDQGGKAAVDQGGFTSPGKPVPLVSNSKERYKGDFSDFETPSMAVEVPEVQALMVQALLSACKGYANMLVPDDCRFHQAATTLIENDVSIPEVTAFEPWWNENGHYPGKPAVKSLLDEIENSINGVKTGRTQKSPEAAVATRELEMWMKRKIKVTEFSSPHTLRAIQEVGETVIRGMTITNRKNVLASFTREFEKAKRDGETI